MTKIIPYLIYSYINLIYYILLIITILITVAFFTLFERKLLRYIHKRKGPNKSSIIGLTQPFADALKLLSKEFIYSPKIKYNIYILSPLFILLISIFIWILFPCSINLISNNYSILLIFCCFRISVYPIILGGWSSNSSYALIGAIRGLSQTISYEVRLAAIIISPILLCETINFYYFKDFQIYINFRIWWWPSVIIIYISCLAEVNRTPFDFIEGESELVSGFNIEYYSAGFTFIFLSEYSIIIWISGLISSMFISNINIIFITLSLSSSIIWIRASLPRIRYDELIYLCWKIFLPLRISILALTIIIKYFIYLNI